MKVCQLEIAESPEKLQQLMVKQKSKTKRERLRALYLFKTKQVETVKELAQVLGRDRATLFRWWREYRDWGLPGLLDIKQGKQKPSLIPASVIPALKERWQSEGFKSYAEIQFWLFENYGIEMKYNSLYKAVRYQIGITISRNLQSTLPE